MKNIFNKPPFIVTPVMEERIISVAYGEGSLFDRFVVHFTRRNNHKVEALYQKHLKTIDLTQTAIEQTICPYHLERRLLNICEDGQQRSSLLDVLNHLNGYLRATGAIAAMLIVGLLIWSNMGPTQEQRELEEAALQAKHSLALVSSIMNGTKKDIHDHVIMERTAKPLHDSIFKGTETIKRNI